MQAEIIAIGTELTNGAKLDTNSQWLSIELAALGIEVTRHTTISDALSEMVEAFAASARRAPLVIITGGLGPTLDDLTRQALADVAEVELELHAPSLTVIEQLFERLGRNMPERNRIQAMFPRGSHPIPNSRGTAPGIDMRLESASHTSRLIALPGVPSEMKPMFHEAVVPTLSGTARVIRQARINCFGAGESRIEEMLGELTARGRDPEIGITAHEATITLRIVAHGADAQECESKIREARTEITERLGARVFGEEDEELHHVVIAELQRRQITVATVEDATGGRIVHLLRSVDGHESCVCGGLVIEPNRLPEGLTGSEPIESVAEKCRQMFSAGMTVAVGPIVDGQVELAVHSPAGTRTAGLSVAGNPAIRQSRVAKAALNLLRLQLLDNPDKDVQAS